MLGGRANSSKNRKNGFLFLGNKTLIKVQFSKPVFCYWVPMMARLSRRVINTRLMVLS